MLSNKINRSLFYPLIAVFLLITSSSILANTYVNTVSGTEIGEQLLGTNDTDLIQGLAGDDTIYGFSGNDRLEGGDGNDTLLGGNGSYVNSGDDILIGGKGNDVLVGEDGNDELEGGLGADHYYYSSNNGVDIITDPEVDQDVLFFLDIAATRLSFHQDNQDLVVLVDSDVTQQVRVIDYFSNAGSQITVQPGGGGFSILPNEISNSLTPMPTSGDDSEGESDPESGGDTDPVDNTGSSGSVINLENIGEDNFLLGTDERNLLFSGAGNDELSGNMGDDLLLGGMDDDIYYINADNGKDIISDTHGINKIIFGASISFSDVANYFVRSNDDLIIRIGDTANQVTIEDFYIVANTVSIIEFSNGSSISSSQLLSEAPTLTQVSRLLIVGSSQDNVLTGSDGGDVIITGIGNDTLRGLSGNDYLVGGAGDDVYEISLNNGKDRIVDSVGSNKIVFSNDIYFNDVASGLAKSGDDLVLTVVTSENKVTVHQFFSLANTVNTFEFMSGGQIDASQLYGLFGMPAPTTNAIIYDLLDSPVNSNPNADDDSDGIDNEIDLCPFTPIAELVNDSGCSESQLDDDNDGLNNTVDLCPNSSVGMAVDSNGCTQSQRDSDNDGVFDAFDECPSTPANSEVDFQGCHDTDGDGVSELYDICPLTDAGKETDGNGCAPNQKDSDSDGFNDELDECPDTHANSSVNAQGCAIEQLDSDNDSVNDDQDQCPNTNAGLDTDRTGCADNQRDTDNDGALDYLDLDDDNDGVLDTEDAFPLDATESVDTDLDGIGNNADTDDDGDSYFDTAEITAGTNPLLWSSNPWAIADVKSLIPMTGTLTSIKNFDDGQKRSGSPRIYQRNNVDEYVVDKVNELIWQDTSDSENLKLNWGEANSYCLNSELGGITSWRLPTRYELLFLIDLESSGRGFRDPMINKVFKHTYRYDGFYAKSYKYWTSDRTFSRDLAIMVDFSSSYLQYENTSSVISARCVSGEEPFNRFYHHREDNIVYTEGLGLMWQDTIEMQSYKANWSDALNYCENLDLADHQDWRLPNIFEANTIIDHLSGGNLTQFKYLHPGGFSDDPEWWLSNSKYNASIDGVLDNIFGPEHGETYAHKIYAYPGTFKQLSRNKTDENFVRCVRTYAAPVVVLQPFPSVIPEGVDIVLDASKSYAPDGSIQRYYWSKVLYGDDSLSESSILTLTDLSVGDHTFYVAVINNNGILIRSEAIEFTVEAGIEHQTPIANAGTDQTVESLIPVMLNASQSSDSNGSIVSYEWKEGETVLSTSVTFTKLDFSIGIHSIKLTVTDDQNLSSSDTVLVTITAPNVAPVANAGDDQTMEEGYTVTLDAAASTDADGSIVSFEWKESSSVLSTSSIFNYNNFSIGTHSIVLSVTDNKGVSSSDTIVITIVEVNIPPIANAGADITITQGDAVILNGVASYDPDGGSLSYRWVNQYSVLLSESETFILNDLAPAEYTFKLFVTDELGLWSTDTITVTVEEKQYNELTVCPVQNITDDSNFIDEHPENNIPWSSGSQLSVKEIEKSFNNARLIDRSVSQYLVLPDQLKWDSMSVAQKGLYLINAERQARGIKPFDGIAPEITSIAQYYSDYHIDNDAQLSHQADGTSSVQRLDSNETIFNNHDMYSRPESLYGSYKSASPNDLNSEVVNAIYNWIYVDKTPYVGTTWGHRNQLLQIGLNENSGSLFSEGIVGFGASAGMYDPLDENIEGAEYGSFVVFNVVDQSATWDMATVESINTDTAQGCNDISQLYIDETSIDLTQLESLEIESTNLMLLVNDSISLIVTAIYNDGSRIDVSGSAQFNEDERSVVSIESGLLTALSEGKAVIYAQVGSITSNRIIVRIGSAGDTTNLIGSKVESFVEYVPENSTVTQYDPKLLSVYTGLILDRSSVGIEGVQISFLNNPEYGTTTTDSSGRFVVAGPSGQQTVIFEKTNYLTIQRKAIGQSTSWTNVETVTLLPFDTKRTFIDFTSGETQVHESTIITDEFGSRKSTVIFNNISSATVKSVDGYERELAEFWLSATEFETPASMPGPLPDNSVFTYCTELHVEGTQYNDTVIFNNDVVMFVDNFLGFEVGEIIPIGYFDMVESNWQASANGVVVRLLDDNNDGTVDGIDHNDDGIADDLNNNGQTADDALGLANYSAGDTLMWGAFNHFTPVDYNLAGSEGDAPSGTEASSEKEDENNDKAECTGSYVMPFQQSFHEDIPIAGTDLTLHYTSQRTKDYKHKINIRVSGDDVNPNILSMTARLEIAGKVYQQDFIPTENISVEFIWDGKDINGKRPKGKVSGRIRVGYEYASTYQSVGIAGFSAFSAFPTMSGFPVAWDEEATRDTGVQTRQNFTTWKNSGISLQNTFESQVAEGWSISNVHEYDPAGTVYKGDGSVFEVAPQSNVIKTGQTFSHIEGDDGYYQAGGKDIDYSVTDNNTIIDINTGLEWQNNAEHYQSTSKAGAASYCENLTEANNSDWRQPTGKESGYTQTKASLTSVPNIFSATRKYFWTTNTYESGAAINAVCVRGESINTRYVENLKRDNSLNVVIDSDNGLMWQDSSENSSVILDFVSSIQYCETLDHADFNDWRLPNINELMYVLPNNSFVNKTQITWPGDGPYLWDYTANYVRAYWSSTSHYSSDTAAWAIESVGFANRSFDKERALYTRCVRDNATASRMPYKFDSDGKHISTIDLDTGKQLIDFIYNNDNQLISLKDQFGNAISINRDTEGTVTSIVAPDGQTTGLSISGSHSLGTNNLDRVSYENNTEFNFYYDDSLLTEKVDRNGHTYSHSFDADGRVIQTSDVEGGQWDFFDDKTQYGENRYGFSTAEGLEYQAIRSILENGDTQKIITNEDGSIVSNILQADQLKETIVSYGVTTVIDKKLDEKTQDEMPSVITITQPSGLTSVTTLDKIYGENGADTSKHTLTVTTNGRTSSIITDAKAGTVVSTSPEGRTGSQQSDPVTLLVQSNATDGLNETGYQYDSRGRITHVTTGERATLYDYSDSNDRGNVSSITSPDGKVTYFDYDLLDRISKTTYPDGHATQTQYDNNGNTKTLVIPTPANHGFTYTGVNKVKTQSTPLNETTQYFYDSDRRLIKVELPSGQLISNDYANGKLDKTTTPEGVIDYQYINGNQLESITEGDESLGYQYDGDLLTSMTHSGQLNSTIEQGYNNNFWLNSLSYAGKSSALTYDNDGLLTSTNGYTISRHAQHGLPTQLSDSKLTQTINYNGYGENTSVSNQVNGKRSYDYDLTYNLIGQITGKTEILADGTSNTFVYGYDDKRRLISVLKNNVQIESYGYDANGNRKLKSNTLAGISNQAATFNIADQQLTDGDAQFEYDANGRLSKKSDGTAVEEYSYSSQGRLLSVIFKQVDQTTSIESTLKTISYQHNALGNRVAKLVDGSVVEKYLWLNKTTLLATYDQNSNLKQRFEYGLSHTPISFTEGSVKYYIGSDHLGSPRTISDENGNVIKAIEYDSFGNVIGDSNESLDIPFGFAGGLQDSDTKLLRFGYRDYSPETGRWTARDPIGFAGGDTNLYGYVASDPVNWIDPDGLVSVQPGGNGILGGVAGGRGVRSGGGGGSYCPPKGAGKLKSKLIQENPKNLISTQTKSEMSGSEVKRLTKDMKKNGFDQSKPVDAWRNPNTGRLEIQDGHHRTEAAKKAGVSKIPVNVWE